jgi:cobalt-zinc-cadmium efflux system protein
VAHVHSPARADARRLVAVFGLSLIVLVVELAGGLAANSLALLADAGHVLADVGGMLVVLIAIWIGARPASRERTFGYLRVEILAAVLNAGLLFAVAAFILYEAWRRLSEPPVVISGLMLAVALFGLVANSISLFLLRDAQARSLSMRGAYLEVLGDLAGSAAAVVAAVLIMVTGLSGFDIVASVLIALLILPRTWRLLRDAIDVLLEATPQGINMTHVRRHILEAPGVADVHDLHAWSITSGVNVVSAHVVLDAGAEPAAVLDHLCECLSDDFDIEHSTFQLETDDRRRLEAATHG